MGGCSVRLRFFALCGLALGVASSACGAAPTVASADLAIKSPDAEATDAWGVEVTEPAGSCTGTLIAPCAVLTAKHCIGKASGLVDLPYAPRRQGAIRQFRTTAKVTHPSLDLAILLLPEAITDVTPPPLGEGQLASGARVTDYGNVKNGEVTPYKMWKHANATVDPAGLFAGENYFTREFTEHGDSGGALLDEDGKVRGVLFGGTLPLVPYDRHTRVDTDDVRGWIAKYAGDACSPKTCAEVARERGWESPACDVSRVDGNAAGRWEGDGSICGGRGVATSDCARCCQGADGDGDDDGAPPTEGAAR
jgi:hypothetical protein